MELEQRPRRPWVKIEMAGREFGAWLTLAVVAVLAVSLFSLWRDEKATREQLDDLVAGRAALVDMRGTKGIVAIRTKLEEAQKSPQSTTDPALAASQPEPGVAFQRFNPVIIEAYGTYPMTRGSFPTTSLAELQANFATEEARVGVAQWAAMVAHIEWYDQFYANLGKATLKRVPLGTIAFWSQGTGEGINIAPYVLLRGPTQPSQEVAGWIRQHGGVTYWAVPVDGAVIGVHTLCDSLFLTFGPLLDSTTELGRKSPVLEALGVEAAAGQPAR